MSKVTYIVLHNVPRLKSRGHRTFANKDMAMGEFAKWKETIKEHYHDDKEEDKKPLFFRKDCILNKPSAFVSIDRIVVDY